MVTVPSRFALTKWYLDLVTDDGIAVVGYWARLRWGPVQVSYVALLRSAPGRAPEERASIRRSDAPHEDNDVIGWHCAPLGLTGAWRRESAALGGTLLDNADGQINWSCSMPRAQATVEWEGVTHEGRGYAEVLQLTIPPHRLPFHMLRWGHHGSNRCAVVWIDWQGDSLRRWVWLDGREQPGSTLSATGLELGDGRAVRFAESRDLQLRPVADAFTPVAPAGVRRWLMGSLGGMREHKVLSRSFLTSADGGKLDEGWAVHEEVTW